VSTQLQLYIILTYVKHVTEGKIKGRIKLTGRRGRRLKQLLEDLKKTGG
jgi:hypothetical protein